MQAEWKIQLNTKVYGCYQQQLTLDEKNHTRLATINEQKDFLNKQNL